ncbi:alkaline phosphatase like protein [Thermosinus carboxydivorans Nor1]|uniref:TVP38/TMEM64 family membrane protein n=1 Tax=Thermosinus carboxydivorans Nor1 TaxID=401526 RepID=A1HSA9_9FIRM|nr:TVP38/TMEM64 family protein [Thermosinus carboxydivorans]EAX47071.1 alkaline phosphatase like protein [Thermosinus carboxydivorans Nor1]
MPLIKIGVLGSAIVAYYYMPGLQEFIDAGIFYLRCRDFEGLRQFILSYGMWAPLTTIALMTIQSMLPLVPGLAITITNAWIFGWQYGALYSWIGALLGATLDFGIARWYGRPVVERFVKPQYLDLMDTFFKKHGVLAVFITRLTPVVPFKVVSYGTGLTAISLWHFIVATGIGQIPAIVLYSILGQNLTRSLRATVAVTSLLILVGVIIYYYREQIERYFFTDKE